MPLIGEKRSYPVSTGNLWADYIIFLISVEKSGKEAIISIYIYINDYFLYWFFQYKILFESVLFLTFAIFDICCHCCFPVNFRTLGHCRTLRTFETPTFLYNPYAIPYSKLFLQGYLLPRYKFEAYRLYSIERQRPHNFPLIKDAFKNLMSRTVLGIIIVPTSITTRSKKLYY